MSNIISNYEISVLDDVLVDDKYEEQRVFVIGSDQMTYQGKVIEPQLTKKANGEKKLTFKMYKQFADNVTGKQVENVFYKELFNERKIKLYYEDKWYNFVIKNIVENSSTYLYTYQLEDALVQELSKNGFDKIFDEQSRNNLGTAEELANRALEDTDWEVEADNFTELVEENLVYLYTDYSFKANRIYNNLDGDIISTKEETIPAKAKLLGFYSSCKSKPHRFQFIYLNSDYGDYDKNLIPTDENRIITVPNCQYYIEVSKQEDYREIEGGYYLPLNLLMVETSSGVLDDSVDTQISYWFKGKRFGYAQKTSYSPLLETYVNEFYKKDKHNQWETELGKRVVYCGFLNTVYNSSIFTENVITNAEFKKNTGWVGTYTGNTPNAKTKYAATAEGTYGRFFNKEFQTAAKALEEGQAIDEKFESYLKVEFPEVEAKNSSNYPFVINSGFYDKRSEIKCIYPDEEWCLDLEIYQTDGTKWSNTTIKNNLSIELWEVASKTSGGHMLKQQYGYFSEKDGRFYIQIDSDMSSISEQEFQNKQIKIIIKPANTEQKISATTFYVKRISLYRKATDEQGNIIEPGVANTKGVVKTVYSFVKKNELDSASDKTSLNIINIKQEELDYSIYVPLYYDKAEKTRTISIKESNYFNILQTIAETFECWLEIIAIRDDITQPGRVTKKKISLKKYLGAENYAAFRYGVNLKDIQRTYESKKLVTKLIVKQNSNELGKDDFCTIARADSNPISDTSIYDFRYFHNRGMLQSSDYVAQLYYETNPYTGEKAQGLDVNSSDRETNAQNYFNRLRKLNNAIYDRGHKLSGVVLEQTKLNADLAIQKGLKSAAEEGIIEVRDKFYTLTGLYPDEINTNPFDEIRIQTKENQWGDLAVLNPSWDSGFVTSDTPVISGGPTSGSTKASTSWQFTIDLQPTFPNELDYPQEVFGEKEEEEGEEETEDITKQLVPHGEATTKTTYEGDKIKSIELTCTDEYDGLMIRPIEGYLKNYRYQLSYTLKVKEGELHTIGSHKISFAQHSISIDGGDKTYSDIYTFSSPLKAEEEINVVLEGTYRDQNTVTDSLPYLFIQPNRGKKEKVVCIITNLKIKRKSGPVKDKQGTYNIRPVFEKIRNGNVENSEEARIALSIDAYKTTGSGSYSLTLVDTSGSTISSLLSQYAEYKQALAEANKKLEGATGLIQAVDIKKFTITSLQNDIQKLQEQKSALNKAFYTLYSRFIQEGTWISEEYIDDDKYYNDALSVLYNSCLPQVAYSVNVVAVSSLPGYEFFKFGLGDKTHVIDPDFFGTEEGMEVVITEQVDNLDDPSKNTVKVQNFKNQFQDLFQKITATVQQAQYSTGSYEKAAALAEANVKIRGRFVTEALEGMAEKLAVAGQTTVVQDQNGITLTDSETKDEMRLIGGAILMSVADPDTGDRTWKTGLTPEGISASLVTAGTLNAGEITIMNANDPVFRWDAFGLTAFDIDWNNGDISGVTNPYKFVRFDKYGIYGINQDAKDSVIDGRSWKPSSLEEIDSLATFALTWEGLKVTGSDGTVAKIGKHSFLPVEGIDENKLQSRIISITNKEGQETFSIDGSGNASFKGHIDATSGKIGALDIEAPNGTYTWKFSNQDGIIMNAGGTPVLEVGNIDGKPGLKITGTIFATAGDIAGWSIGSQSLTSEASIGKENSIHLYTSYIGNAATVGGHSSDNWRLTIGSKFGVDRYGNIYANQLGLNNTKITSDESKCSITTSDELILLAKRSDNKSTAGLSFTTSSTENVTIQFFGDWKTGIMKQVELKVDRPVLNTREYAIKLYSDLGFEERVSLSLLKGEYKTSGEIENGGKQFTSMQLIYDEEPVWTWKERLSILSVYGANLPDFPASVCEVSSSIIPTDSYMIGTSLSPWAAGYFTDLYVYDSAASRFRSIAELFES